MTVNLLSASPKGRKTKMMKLFDRTSHPRQPTVKIENPGPTGGFAHNHTDRARDRRTYIEAAGAMLAEELNAHAETAQILRERRNTAKDALAAAVAADSPTEGLQRALDMAQRAFDTHGAKRQEAIQHSAALGQTLRAISRMSPAKKWKDVKAPKAAMGMDRESALAAVAAAEAPRKVVAEALVPFDDAATTVVAMLDQGKASAPRLRLQTVHVPQSRGKELVRHDPVLIWPTVPVLNGSLNENREAPSVVDAKALYIAGHYTELKISLLADLAKAYEGRLALSAAERKARLEEIDAAKLEAEHLYCHLVWQDFAEGRGELDFPAGTAPEAILGIRLVA